MVFVFPVPPGSNRPASGHSQVVKLEIWRKRQWGIKATHCIGKRNSCLQLLSKFLYVQNISFQARIQSGRCCEQLSKTWLNHSAVCLVGLEQAPPQDWGRARFTLHVGQYIMHHHSVCDSPRQEFRLKKCDSVDLSQWIVYIKDHKGCIKYRDRDVKAVNYW